VRTALPPTTNEREAKVKVCHAHNILCRGFFATDKWHHVVLGYAGHYMCAINGTYAILKLNKTI
jgi:hypothetical protein